MFARMGRSPLVRLARSRGGLSRSPSFLVNTMNTPLVPQHPRSRPRSAPRHSLAASAAALMAAMLALEAVPDLRAATGTWQANAADQSVPVTITVDSAAWKVAPQLMEGDTVLIGTTGGVGLGSDRSYYYAVGVGSTPGDIVRFSQSPGAVTFSPNGGNSPLAVTKMASWFVPGNWAGGVVPDGVGDEAVIVANANTPTIVLDHDVTVGALNIDTTEGAATGLSLISGSRDAGPFSTLTFATASGTPTVVVSGGKTFSLSESKVSGNIPGNASAKLTVVGAQGLVIDNQNPVVPPVAVNSSTATPAVPLYAPGAVRFGFGLDWSKFDGDLTLARGVFQPLAGGSLNNNLSSLPLANKVVLGTGTNTARLEILGNGSSGPSSIRGLESTSPNSSIINTSGGGQLTFQVGSYGRAGDSYTFAGNIGDATDIATVASVSAVRLVKIGAGTQTLSGPNNFDAVVTDGVPANQVILAVNGGKLSLGTTGAIGTVTDGQGAANAGSSVVFHNGELEISGLGVAAPRSQSFGAFAIFGSVTSTTTGTADDKQAAQSNSFSTLTAIADPAHPTTLTFGGLRPRNFLSGSPTSVLAGVTQLYRGTNLGSTPGAGVASIFFTTAPTVNGGNLYATGGSGTLGVPGAPVLRGALADTSPTGHGVGFATYDPATGVRPLAAAERTVVATGAAYDGASSNDNIRLDLSAPTPITGHRSNTLELRNTSGSAQTVTNTGTELDAANGLLFSGTDPIVLAGGQITGTGYLDSEDVIIHTINSAPAGVTLQTAVSNVGLPGGNAASHRQGWITFNGGGNLRVEGPLTVGNTGGLVFNGTGTTTVAASVTDASSFNFNQGLVKFDAGATWNGVPRLLVAAAGKVDLNGIGGSPAANRFSDINVPINPAGLSVNAAGGEVTNSSATTVDLYLSGTANGAGNQNTSTAFFGTITGNLNLVVDKSTSTTNAETGEVTYTYGTQALANANTYTGSTHIKSGVLNLSRGGRLPATTVVTLGTEGSAANSTLTLGDGNGSTNGSVRQEIAGLHAVGTGTAAVLNNGANIGQLTLNIPEGVDNVYTGNLGLTPSANGNAQNLFGLRKTGAGSFEAAGPVIAYTGGTIIEGGFLRVASDAALGQIGSLTGVAGSGDAPEAPISAFANSIVLDGGTLQATTTPDFVLNPKRGIGLGPTSGSTGGGGGIWVNSGVKLTYAGVIASAGNTGTQTLVKNGPGVLALDGASTFPGTTQVLAGDLGGTGSLASGVTVESGGALAPGNGGIGTFTINGPLTLNAGAALNLELAAPGSSDLLQLGGAIHVAGTTTINIEDLAGFGLGTYTLISGTAPISPSGFVVNAPAGFKGTLGSVGNTLSVTIEEGSALTPLEDWRLTNFGNSANTGTGADTFDADGDGIANLVEYATNTDPNVANPSPTTVARAGNFLTLTYTRVADTTLTYTVEGSNDLATWSTVTTANNPSTGAMNTAGPVTVTDTVALGAGRRFLRLKVSY